MIHCPNDMDYRLRLMQTFVAAVMLVLALLVLAKRDQSTPRPPTPSATYSHFFAGDLQAQRWQHECARLEPKLRVYADMHTLMRHQLQQSCSGSGSGSRPRILLAPYTGHLNCCLGNIVSKLVAVLALGMASGRAVFIFGGRDDAVASVLQGHGFNWSLPDECVGVPYGLGHKTIHDVRPNSLKAAFAPRKILVLTKPTYVLWESLLKQPEFSAFVHQHIEPFLVNRSFSGRVSYTTPMRWDFVGCLHHFMLDPSPSLRRILRGKLPPSKYNAVHVRLARVLMQFGMSGFTSDHLAIQNHGPDGREGFGRIDAWMVSMNHNKSLRVVGNTSCSGLATTTTTTTTTTPLHSTFDCIRCSAPAEPIYLASESAKIYKAAGAWSDHSAMKVIQHGSASSYVPNNPHTKWSSSDIVDAAVDYMMMSGASQLFLQLSFKSSLATAALERSLVESSTADSCPAFQLTKVH